jgi:hypothetical protein
MREKSCRNSELEAKIREKEQELNLIKNEMTELRRIHKYKNRKLMKKR